MLSPHPGAVGEDRRMPTVDYLLYDVFTDTPFTGNPLAV